MFCGEWNSAVDVPRDEKTEKHYVSLIPPHGIVIFNRAAPTT
jgi:hypothetical protein